MYALLYLDISKYLRHRKFSLDFFDFSSTLFNTASSAARPSESTVTEDAGIHPRTVVTSALAVCQTL
jgi:hypothetical protein